MKPQDLWTIIAVVSFAVGFPLLVGWFVTKEAFGRVDLRLQILESRRKKKQPTASARPGRLGSQICWCYIYGRNGDLAMFECNNSDGLLSVMLHGYAIVPLEAIAYDDDEVLEPLKEFAISYMERESNQ